MPYVFNIAKEQWAKATDSTWDFDGDTFKILLLRSDGSHNPVYDPTDATLSALLTPATMTECTETGYVRQTLSSVSLAASGNSWVWKAQKATFAITGTAQSVSAAVIYDDTQTGDPPVCFLPFDEEDCDNANIEIRFSGTDGVGIIVALQE
jgi:hypothetical protein